MGRQRCSRAPNPSLTGMKCRARIWTKTPSLTRCVVSFSNAFLDPVKSKLAATPRLAENLQEASDRNPLATLGSFHFFLVFVGKLDSEKTALFADPDRPQAHDQGRSKLPLGATLTGRVRHLPGLAPDESNPQGWPSMPCNFCRSSARVGTSTKWSHLWRSR